MEYRVLPTTVVCADRDRAEQVVQWLAQVDTHWAQAASIVDGAIAQQQWLANDNSLWPTGLLVVDGAVVNEQGEPLWRCLLPSGSPVAMPLSGMVDEQYQVSIARLLVVLVDSPAAEVAAIEAGALDALVWSALAATGGLIRLGRSLRLVQGVLANWERQLALAAPFAEEMGEIADSAAVIVRASAEKPNSGTQLASGPIASPIENSTINPASHSKTGATPGIIPGVVINCAPGLPSIEQPLLATASCDREDRDREDNDSAHPIAPWTADLAARSESGLQPSDDSELTIGLPSSAPMGWQPQASPANPAGQRPRVPSTTVLPGLRIALGGIFSGPSSDRAGMAAESLLTGPEIRPEIEPEIRPETSSDPGIRPEINPEINADTSPGVNPEINPENSIEAVAMPLAPSAEGNIPKIVPTEGEITAIQGDRLPALGAADRSQAASQSWLAVLDQVLDHTIDGIVIVNREGRIDYANPAACQLFGRSPEQLVGEHLGIPIGSEKTTEIDILHPDGSVGVGDLNVSPIEWLGEPAYAVAIRDVSDRKRVEADLRYRLSLESVVAYVARLLVTADDDVRFGSVLEAVGRAMLADRVLLLHGPMERPLLNLACEWHEENQMPVVRDFNRLGGHLPPLWTEQLGRDRAVVIESRQALQSEDSAVTEWLNCLGANSVLIAAIHDRRDALWGALVLCVHQARSWLAQDLQILQTIGDTIYAWYDRQATQDRLRASEALYSSIFERSDERIFLVNVHPDGRFTYETVNPAFERALEHRATHIIGRSPQDLFPPSCATPIIARFRACVAGRDTIRCEEELMIRGKQRIWHTSLVPIRDAWNRVIKLLGSARDITQEREAALQRNNQNRYRQLLASIAFKIRQSLDIQVILGRTVSELQKTLKADRVMFYRCQADGNGSIAAEAIAQPFGAIDPSHTWCCTLNLDNTHPNLDRYWQGQISCEDDLTQLQLSPEQRSCIDSLSIRSQVIVPVTIAAVHFNPSALGFVPPEVLTDRLQPATILLGLLCLQQCQGPRHWTSFEIDLLQQLAGQLSIALYQAHLLEERTRAIEGLRRSNEQLQQFAYVASHDLQEPLRGIIAFSEMLTEECAPQLDQNAQEYLQFIIDSGQRMRQLIRDLLAYSRVETRGRTLEPVDCSQIIEIVLNNLRLAIQDNQATIQAKNLPIVLADSMQLAQLFQNLIGNALKFRGKSNPVITITANHEEHHWRFQVIDNGIGIDPQYSERIFNIFQRLHNREEYEGTGIGLAICRKIIERHGGSIGVQSQLGQGSSFWFTIPDQPETIPITELSFSPS